MKTKHDRKNEVVAGYRDGKKVQGRYNTGFHNLPACGLPKPVLKVVPLGDLTWDQAKRLTESGVATQYYSVNKWIDNVPEESDVWPENLAYRRKPDKPAPKMVPLDAVLDLVNEAVADLKRDLAERCEKEAK